MQMQAVTIHRGHHRGRVVQNETYHLVRPFKVGANGGFVTVKNDEGVLMRIKVAGHDDFSHDEPVVARVTETDDQVMERIGERFDILEEMTRAAMNNDVRAMIVVGPPGVGKSYGIERELRSSECFDKLADNVSRLSYTIVKGAMTAIGLYQVLYNYSDKNNVIVFDDCDSVFNDELSLNLLKAALDSGKRRRICWNSDSHTLRREGIPDSFDFKGSVIFITNLNLENVKSKKLQDHLDALRSRCHYLDLTMNTEREKFLRIKQIHRTGSLFRDYSFTEEQSDEVMEFMETNRTKLREISLRMALKIADLTKVSPNNWKALARATCMKN